MRYYTIHNDILAKVFDLMKDQSLLLNLTVIKYMKSVVCNNDEFLNKLIISNDYFEPVLTLFKENSHKNNLILSSILDLFDFIRRENIKKLITFIVNFFPKNSLKNTMKRYTSNRTKNTSVN
jgi:protein phosphatase-4 regulatory subunit 3